MFPIENFHFAPFTKYVFILQPSWFPNVNYHSCHSISSLIHILKHIKSPFRSYHPRNGLNHFVVLWIKHTCFPQTDDLSHNMGLKHIIPLSQNFSSSVCGLIPRIFRLKFRVSVAGGLEVSEPQCGGELEALPGRWVMLTLRGTQFICRKQRKLCASYLASLVVVPCFKMFMGTKI